MLPYVTLPFCFMHSLTPAHNAVLFQVYFQSPVPALVLLWFQCKSDFIFHNMYLPFFFGSTYITLMVQNSKKFLIIFLPKKTHKNCAFSIVLHTVFMRFSVLSGKTKSVKEAVFCEDFHII